MQIELNFNFDLTDVVLTNKSNKQSYNGKFFIRITKENTKLLIWKR